MPIILISFMKEEKSSITPFDSLLQELSHHISEARFQDSLLLFNQTLQFSEEEDIELKSLHAYALIMTKQYSPALKLLEENLEKRPFHLPSKKRKAVLLEKMGKYEESRSQFQKCLLLEPESRSLRNKIKRLNMSQSHSEGVSSDSKESSNFSEKEEVEKIPSVVKFGSFQVIEFTTEDSDEQFAILKEEISKLSDNKPKKSILKESMSASLFKGKGKEVKSDGKIEETGQSNDEEAPPKLYEKKKKKSKSVKFEGDTHLQDVE